MTALAMRRPSVVVASVAILGALGWVWLGWVALALARAPIEPRTGFDLQLLIDAGRHVAAGRSPYDPSLVAGVAPVAESLFYSYPPVVAQAMALLAPLPDTAILLLWDGAAVAGLAIIVALLSRQLRPGQAVGPAVVGVLAAAPLCFPFAIGLLFGNLDVFFPLLYGAMLLAVLPGASNASERVGGVGLAVATLAKLHPGSLGAWFLVRGVHDRGARRAFVVAVAVGVAVVAVSVLVGGAGLWSDYLGVVRAGSNADLIDPDNAGPAVQLALALGRDDSFARAVQVAVTGLALLVTVLAAWRSGDAVESLAWAAAASLATLPVTWYHYPSAMIPFGVAAILRGRGTPSAARTTALLLAAALFAAVAIVAVALIWVAIALVLVAVRVSRRRDLLSADAAAETIPVPGRFE